VAWDTYFADIFSRGGERLSRAQWEELHAGFDKDFWAHAGAALFVAAPEWSADPDRLRQVGQSLAKLCGWSSTTKTPCSGPRPANRRPPGLSRLDHSPTMSSLSRPVLA
jgi:hypothetical protein